MSKLFCIFLTIYALTPVAAAIAYLSRTGNQRSEATLRPRRQTHRLRSDRRGDEQLMSLDLAEGCEPSGDAPGGSRRTANNEIVSEQSFRYPRVDETLDEFRYAGCCSRDA